MSSGAPDWTYLRFRESVSLISGAPVSNTFTPAAGDWATTTFAA
jgi:hypothetical protein